MTRNVNKLNEQILFYFLIPWRSTIIQEVQLHGIYLHATQEDKLK